MGVRGGVRYNDMGPFMPPLIILIGTVRTTKTTIARLLAEKPGVLRVSLDENRWNYYFARISQWIGKGWW